MVRVKIDRLPDVNTQTKDEKSQIKKIKHDLDRMEISGDIGKIWMAPVNLSKAVQVQQRYIVDLKQQERSLDTACVEKCRAELMKCAVGSRVPSQVDHTAFQRNALRVLFDPIGGATQATNSALGPSCPKLGEILEVWAREE